MRRLAGLAMAALLAGCGAAYAPPQPVDLQYGPDLAEGFGALPRVEADTPQAQAVNTALDQVDARDRANRESCLEAKAQNDNVEWGRSVAVPMKGPRFISIVMDQGDYCGGAHPNSGRTPLVFDLETGRLIDWKAWLPADMAAPIDNQDADAAAALQSPTLKAWFAERALAEMSPEGKAECAELYSEQWRDEWRLAAWPDAKAGGLRLQTAGLAHASKGCETEVLMPLRELKRRGVAREFTAALEVAYRTGQWRDAPKERERAK
jgi:hypothetical protein